MNNTASPLNMLAVFDTIRIDNDQKISAADRQFCQQQQQMLYTTLDQIDKWYAFFTQEAVRYKQSHRITYAENGTIKTNDPYRPYDDYPSTYSDYEFKPFDQINKLVEKRSQAISRFSRAIIIYFNKNYNLEVKHEEIDTQKLSVTFRPAYHTYVDQVIGHLGGHSFRQKAEEEILFRFKDNILATYKKMPELKGDKIIFHEVVRFDDFYAKNYSQYQISYNYRQQVEVLCEGIAYAAANMLNGNTAILSSFDPSYVNITRPYTIDAGSAHEMKFYGNGRIDIRFLTKPDAEKAFRKLQLHNINFAND